jgi:hypothetical protein
MTVLINPVKLGNANKYANLKRLLDEWQSRAIVLLDANRDLKTARVELAAMQSAADKAQADYDRVVYNLLSLLADDVIAT